MEWATSAGTRAAEGVVVALAAPLAPELALAGPDERRGVGVPATRGRFEPVDDVHRRSRGPAGERTADKDALYGFGHVQPGAAERGVQWHDAVGDQPENQARGLVAGQVVQDQQHPQGRQTFGQGERDGEPFLPALPGRTTLGLGLDWRLGPRREDRRQFSLQPGVQHLVGGTRDALDADLARGRVKQGQ
jgi:hypothetical protein